MSKVVRRGAAVGAATVCALVLWAGAGGDPVAPGGQHVGAAAVLITSVVVGLAGWGLLAVLERFTPRHAFAIWATVATLVYGFSLLGIVGAESVGTLLGLHTIVYVVLMITNAQSVRAAHCVKPVV